MRPDLQAGKSSGLAKVGPGHLFMQGTTIKYWLAEGSKVVDSDRGDDRESDSGRTAELDSKQWTWPGLGHDDVGRGEPRWWQRSAGKHESFEFVTGGGRSTATVL